MRTCLILGIFTLAMFSLMAVRIGAEPYEMPMPCFIPNDSLYSVQWPLTHIHAPTAWDYSPGSSSVIIGFVGTGTDTAHPDLRNNLWINPGEDLNHNGIVDPSEINGRDDDHNGYADDFYGWNFAQNNNNVYDNTGHGTYCDGVATAVTNNTTGIASLGCKARIMTAKCGDSYFVNTPEAIAYCANMGANIISLSWASYTFVVAEQAAITYARNQGAIIVASAGANNSQIPMYPAAYEHVVGVGATDQNDHLMSFSNFGTWVDCYSPYGNISTFPGGGYQYMTGTSFCNPMVAGAAALIIARQPTMTNDQVVNHILATCSIIDSLNPGHPGLMRRLDAGAALAGLFLHTTLTPHNPSITIPPVGGNFGYDLTVSNSDTVARPTQFWCKEQLPNRSWSGPLVGPVSLTLLPGSAVSRTRTQTVPGSAPPGNYLFVAFLGEYPGSISSRDTIAFVKQGSQGGDEGFEPWQTDGGDDGLGAPGPRDAQSITAPAAPHKFEALEVYPNPFNPITAIRYELQAASQVQLTVWDTAGRLVATLVDGWREAGNHEVRFDGSNLASGIYLARLEAGSEVQVEKVVLLK